MNKHTESVRETKVFGQNQWAELSAFYGIDTENLINFGECVWPFELPDELQQILHQTNANYTQAQFRRNASAYYHLPAQSVLGVGGAEAVLQTIIASPQIQRVLTVEPTRPLYHQIAEQTEKEWVWFPALTNEVENGRFALPVPNLTPKLQPGDLVCLQHPNDPTGSALNEADIETIIAAADENGAGVVIDESLIELISIALVTPFILKYYNLYVLRSLSHFFGLKEAYVLLTHPERMQHCEHLMAGHILDSRSLQAGEWVLTHSNLFEHRRESWVKGAKAIAQALASLPQCQVFPPQTTFVLFRLTNAEAAAALQQHLVLRGIFVPSAKDRPGLDETNLYACSRDEAANQQLIEALAAFK